MLRVRNDVWVGVWKQCRKVLDSLEMRRWRTGNHLRPFWQCWHCGVGEGLQKQIYKMHKGEHKKLRVMVCGQWLWHLYESKSVDTCLLASL